MIPTSQIAPQTTPPTSAHPPTASAAITGTTGKHHGRRAGAVSEAAHAVAPRAVDWCVMSAFRFMNSKANIKS
jgi:hypothetical protein